MIQPITQDLTCFIGGSWDQQFIFWDDQGNTVPHSFAGTTPSFVVTYKVNGITQTLTGTATVVSTNNITCSLTSVQTAGLPATRGHYVLSVATAATPPHVDYMAKGAFTITAP